MSRPLAAMLAPVLLAPIGAAFAGPPTFESPIHFTFPASLSPTRAAFVDLDGDGVLDAICPGRNSAGRAYLLRGTGTGAFVDPIELTIGDQTDWAEVADVDGDGVLDLVFAVRSGAGRVALRRGLGGFSFGPNETIETGRDARAVAIEGVDENGRRSILVLNHQNSTLRRVTLEGSGPGTLAAGPWQFVGPWVAGIPLPQWLGRADADGDGSEDTWISVNGGGIVRLVRGTDDADFGEAVDWRPPLVGEERPGLLLGSIGDIDGNGTLDLAIAGLTVAEPQSVLIFLNDGAGGLADRWTVPATTGGFGWSCAVADLDLDGDRDLVLTTALPGQVIVLENLGGLPHPDFKVVQELSLGNFARHVAVADMNGDCRPDLVVSDFPGNRISVFRNATPELEGCGGGVAEQSSADELDRSRAVAIDERSPGPAPSRDDEVAASLRLAVDRALPRGAIAVAQALGDHPALAPTPTGAGVEVPSPLRGARRRASSGEGGIAGGFEACGPGAGACNEPHGGLGCYTPDCCEAVCNFDPVCCTVAWDEVCVFNEGLLCEGLVCPSAGSCFVSHPTRACDDEACCERVGRLDPYCHNSRWDGICVAEALLFCDLGACALPPPPPESVSEGEPCYERFNQGCAPAVGGISAWIELGCGDRRHGTCTSSAPRDLDWLSFELDAPRRVRLEASAEFPMRLLLLEGPCDGGLRTIVDSSSLDCATTVIERCLEPGDYHAVIMLGIAERLVLNGQPCEEIDPRNPPDPKDPPIVPGYFGVDWQVAFSCPHGEIPGDFDGSGTVDGSDLGTLLGFWGPNPEGDLDCDGVVDGSDLGTLLGNWTG